MKVNEEEIKDKYGEYPAAWISGYDATPQRIWEWLWCNGYQGYKFAIVFDLMGDEWEKPEKQTPLYCLDSLLDEVIDYYGVDKVKERIKQIEEGKVTSRW